GGHRSPPRSGAGGGALEGRWRPTEPRGWPRRSGSRMADRPRAHGVVARERRPHRVRVRPRGGTGRSGAAGDAPGRDRDREAVRESYAGLSNAELVEPGVSGAWSVRDIIAHVTWWEEEALTHLPLIVAGGRPPRYSVTYGGIDAFNAKRTEERKDLLLVEVL